MKDQKTSLIGCSVKINNFDRATSIIREYTNDSGEDTIESGRYITIWELQKDGSYKVTVDLGY